MTVVNHLTVLHRRHAELEDKIRAWQQHPGADDLELQDLKKRKLQVKEEIARLEKV